MGPDIEEEELIDAFKKHGRLQGYKLIRGSNCGSIDFERVEDAASAREALHEATFASCQLRVEFKVKLTAIASENLWCPVDKKDSSGIAYRGELLLAFIVAMRPAVLLLRELCRTNDMSCLRS